MTLATEVKTCVEHPWAASRVSIEGVSVCYWCWLKSIPRARKGRLLR